MQKSVRKTLFLSLLIFSLLFLISCSKVAGGETPPDTAARLKAVQTGTQGIVLRIMPNAPPPIIYDRNELVAIVDVDNKGNFPLEPTECFIQVTGFDPTIIKGSMNSPHSCAENYPGIFEGKTIYNLNGGTNQIEFRSPNVILPPGVQEYSPILNFLSCYHYHTIANPQICVDPLFYQVTSQQKTCIPKSVGMTGGQGAPVAISNVGVEMTGGRAVFTITINNIGGGRVLSPYANYQECGQASIARTDEDKVVFDVKLAGASLVDCKPRDKIVRLNNGIGQIFCTFNIPGSTAYETPLSIDLDYSYMQSFTRPIKIVKTPE
ncbi:hypothetical protein HYX11_03660 [Candidatus Woesearchaeota archaeon]|nr:hypothetical protein [Candidatus Woesearchaeota archaeon]